MAVHVETQSLTLVRTYQASPEKVFKAWTDASILSRWFGCSDEIKVTEANLDARTGGHYKITMHDPSDGVDFHLSGKYLDVTPVSRLQFTWLWDCVPFQADETTVTVDIRPLDGGSELTVTHEGLNGPQSLACHEEGWTHGLKTLEGILGV